MSQFDKWAKTVPIDQLARLAQAIDAQLVRCSEPHEKPDFIVAAAWPTRFIGARQGKCQKCNALVSLAPNSQRILALHPDVIVFCFDCSMQHVEHTNEEITP